MKKYFNLMLAAILICGASVFTSCTNSDNPAQPVETDLNVAEKIIGKWITAESDGEIMPTNEKVVLDFVSTTEAYVSLSIQDRTAEDTPWRDREEIDVEINGNDVILFHSPKPGMNVTVDLHVESITDATLIAKRIVTIRQDGGLVRSTENIIRYEKLNVDYRNAICGMWEGRMTSEQSVYGDVEDHRWEYMTDGTFNFFRKVDDQWQISDDDFSDYFVAGNLLCTRWKNAGEGNEENREWWEIESIENGVMKWKALRQREDGSTYTATFEMKKIELSPSDYKCSRVEVIYRITSPKTNYDYFEGKIALKSGNEVKEIKKLLTFAEQQNEGYNINDIAAFPVEEAICLHYGIKDGLESYAGDYSLNWEMSYTVTSYNAEGYKLDSQTISDRWSENGKVQKKEDLEDAVKLSYSELHASVAEDGKITLSIENKMHPERSGIDW